MNRRSCALAALLAASACSTAAPAITAITAPEDTGSLRVNSQVFYMLFARTQQTAVALTADQRLRILSLPDGGELRAIDYGDRPVNAMAFSQDGAAVALGDRTGLVSVWDAATGQLRFDHKLPRYPGLLVFSPDGHRLAITAEGDAAQILDAGTGSIVMTLGSQVGGHAHARVLTRRAVGGNGRW